MFPGIKLFYFEVRKEMTCIFFQDLPLISSSVYTGNCCYQSCLQVVNRLLQNMEKIYFCGHQWIFFCIFAADPVWHHCCKWDHGHFSSYHRPSGHEDKVCLLLIHVFLPCTILTKHWEPCQTNRSKPELYSQNNSMKHIQSWVKKIGLIHNDTVTFTKKCWERMKWMGWEIRLWQRATRTTAHFTNLMTFISPRP